jgi:mRNA interferase MazF
MRRGEIWTVAGGAAYTGKPRPAVIIQDDRFDANDSIVVCPLTTDPTSAPIFRLPIPSNTRTGLRAPSRLMVDKLTAVARKRLGSRLGTLSPDELKTLNRSVFVFLGLSETATPQDSQVTPLAAAPQSAAATRRAGSNS